MKILIQILVFFFITLQLSANDLLNNFDDVDECIYSSTPPCRQSDSLNLVALYNSTNGANWTTTWNLNLPMDTWYGIALNENGCVICIDMDGGSNTCVSNGAAGGNNLSGTLPTDIGNIIHLDKLILNDNYITGNIPLELGNLNNLTTLILSYNQLSGSIPPELGNLTNLINLSLGSNQLSGSIPPELGNLTNLTSLDLSGNQLNNTIPTEFSNLSNLTFLYLNSNQLTGGIPSVLGDLSNLRNLYLNSNQLTGSIPSELGNLGNLECLYLGGNQLNGNIPSDLGNLSNLRHLSLFANQLTGSIPTEIGNLNNLEYLHVSYNQLSGNMPIEIGNLTALTFLDFGGNQLSGSIPSEIGNLNNLVILSLSGNNFSGSIPSEIGNLNNLTELWISNNQLSGCYPNNLSSLCVQLGSNSTNYFVSDGNNFDTTWEGFCSSGTSTCSEGVFPGDCNTDGIVNIDDVLFWALAVGFSGTPRPNATIDCSTQACPDWSQSVNGVNSKHQDGDGNGIVDNQDNQVIVSNFGCTQSYAAPTYTANAPVYRIQPQGINNDGKYQYDLYVENGSGAAAVAHGVAFTINSDVIPVSAITMSTTGSSLYPDEIITVFDGNQCHTALTRTNNYDTTCGGPIATFSVETNDVPLNTPFEIDITYGSKITADATLDNITGASAFGMYNGIGPISSNLTLDASVTHEKCDALGEAIAIPSGGVSPYTYTWNTGASTAQVNNLASGTYTITVSDANGLSQSLTLQINGQTPIYDANGNLLCGNLCPDFLAPSGVTGTGLYSADNTLDSDATIPTNNTTQYKAGQIIKLDQGFTVQPNAEFSAEIEDCQ